MAWSKVGESTFTRDDNTTGDHTLPGSPAENDIVLVLAAADLLSGEDITINTTGYNTLESSTGGAPTRKLAWKRLTSTPDTVVNISVADTLDTQVAAGLIQIWRGANTTTAIDATMTEATGASGMPDSASFTTATNGAIRIIVGTLDDDDTTATAPANFGNLVTKNTGQSSTSRGTTVMIASQEEATAGAEDPAAFGQTGSPVTGSDAWWSGHFALRPAASATHYTIVAATTSYAYTATAVTFRKTSKFVPAAASYAYTATAAFIERGFPFVAASAAYLFTPTAATFRQTSILTAAGSSFAYTATAATFKVGYKIAAATTAYAYTASAVTFRGTHILAVAGATFAYTASAATFRVGYRVSAESAAYTFSPQALTWDRTYILAAAAGAYLYSATAVDIYHGRKLAAAAGVYVFTASDADIIYTPLGAFVLAADGAAYSFSATAATIKYGRSLAPAAAAYVYTAFDANIIYEPLSAYIFAADGSAYSYSATAALIEYGRSLVPESAAYVYTAQDVGFTYVPTAPVTGGAPSYGGYPGYSDQDAKKWRRAAERLIELERELHEAKTELQEDPETIVEAEKLVERASPPPVIQHEAAENLGPLLERIAAAREELQRTIEAVERERRRRINNQWLMLH